MERKPREPRLTGGKEKKRIDGWNSLTIQILAVGWKESKVEWMDTWYEIGRVGI